MKEFLDYVENSSDACAAEAESPWVKDVHRQVQKVKQSKELEVEYVKTYLTYQDKFKDGIKTITQLNSYLLENDMLDELRRSVVDADYQKELLLAFENDTLTATVMGA